MAFIRTIRRYLKYPLMWVMLLWALTLPGHELAVYSFLMKGSAVEVAASLKSVSGEQDDFSVKQQGVQVFLDANTASTIVVSPQQIIRCVLPLFTFTHPLSDQSYHTTATAGVELISQLFLITIQPNAP